MRLVMLETPFAGDVDADLAFGRSRLADCLARCEAPMASHLLYTQPGVLDDAMPDERGLTMAARHSWMQSADAVVVYTAYGISPGMSVGIEVATELKVPIEYRLLGAKLNGKAADRSANRAAGRPIVAPRGAAR